MADSCRMYEKKYPEVDELVMVNVKAVAEMGAYVSLLEYDNIEGMILHSELSRRRIRSINKLIRVGRTEAVIVLRVDKEKGYIDLSKRRVSPEDIGKLEDKYNKSKAVHSILRHVAETTHNKMIDLYEQFGWPLARQYGHLYEAFRQAVTDPSKLDGYPIAPDVKEALLVNIRRRLTPQPVKLRADFELTCFQAGGIADIKDALRAGEAVSTEDEEIKVKLIAPPLYVMVTTSLDKDRGIQLLGKALEAVQAVITERTGNLTIKVKPRAVSEKEERELSEWLKDLEQANKEVSGDDDASDED